MADDQPPRKKSRFSISTEKLLPFLKGGRIGAQKKETVKNSQGKTGQEERPVGRRSKDAKNEPLSVAAIPVEGVKEKNSTWRPHISLSGVSLSASATSDKPLPTVPAVTTPTTAVAQVLEDLTVKERVSESKTAEPSTIATQQHGQASATSTSRSLSTPHQTTSTNAPVETGGLKAGSSSQTTGCDARRQIPAHRGTDPRSCRTDNERPWHEARWPGPSRNDRKKEPMDSEHDSPDIMPQNASYIAISRGAGSQIPEVTPTSSAPPPAQLSLQSSTATLATTSTHPTRDHEPLRIPVINTSREQVTAGSARHVHQDPPHGATLDLDRDATGVLLPNHVRRNNPHWFKLAHKIRRTPENLYTSPKRLENAIKNSTASLKRKRATSTDAPPAYIYTRSGDPDFNIFANGFLFYPELCFALAAQMPLRDLVNLYALSRDFHTIIDCRFTTTCLSQVLRKAPESAKTFRFRAYAQYSRNDPVNRIPHPNPAQAAKNLPRTIPSFRWVGFVLHREKVVHELITVFAERACPLPAQCSIALKKIWFLMDLPDNARRIGLIHNTRFVTDLDLHYMMCFFVKLDMIANDPLATEKRDGLRKLLLYQQGGLDVINKVLKREMWRKKSDYLTAYARTILSLHQVNDEQLDEDGVDSVFGVPRHEVGKGKLEYWGQGGATELLIRPDQLVQREAIRRGITFSGHILKCALYGYVNPDTLEDYEPRDYGGRRIPEWKDEDYDINDSVGGLRALSIEDGGDPLLDLGDTSRGSRYIIKKEPVSGQERALREAQDDFTAQLYAVSKQERQSEKAARKAARRAARGQVV